MTWSTGTAEEGSGCQQVVCFLRDGLSDTSRVKMAPTYITSPASFLGNESHNAGMAQRFLARIIAKGAGVIHP